MNDQNTIPPLLARIPQFWLIATGLIGLFLQTSFYLIMERSSRIPGNGQSISQARFELAWTRVRAQGLLDSWGPDAPKTLHTVILQDFGFIVGYVLFLASLALWLAQRDPSPLLAKLGIVAAALMVLAGLLDALENLTMLACLKSPNNACTLIAGACSSVKFSMIGLTLVYIGAAVLALVRHPTVKQ